ncbi:MAG: MoaD/ThiS family protein [Mycobacteriales bacterium]
MVCIRFWAGAREVAGVAEQSLGAGSLTEVLAALRREHGPRMEALLSISVLLLDGGQVARDADVDVPDGSTLEVLPPYAGGSR